MDYLNYNSLSCYDSIEDELEMRKKYKLRKWKSTGMSPMGDERMVIGGVPIIFDHQRQEIILNKNIKQWQFDYVCDYLVEEGYIDK